MLFLQHLQETTKKSSWPILRWRGLLWPGWLTLFIDIFSPHVVGRFRWDGSKWQNQVMMLCAIVFGILYGIYWSQSDASTWHSINFTMSMESIKMPTFAEKKISCGINAACAWERRPHVGVTPSRAGCLFKRGMYVFFLNHALYCRVSSVGSCGHC